MKHDNESQETCNVIDERPLTVREAAKYLGVSPQTVYLWVERKQIPHLRVMGRTIRFLKSDLEPFRASFKREMENDRPVEHDGVVYQREGSRFWWICYRDRAGKRQRESTLTPDWHDSQQDVTRTTCSQRW